MSTGCTPRSRSSWCSWCSARCMLVLVSALAVTMPHKADVAGLSKSSIQRQRAAERQHGRSLGDGRLKGYSTDGAASLRPSPPKACDQREHVGVLGAGAASRAIIDAMAVPAQLESPSSPLGSTGELPWLRWPGRSGRRACEQVHDCDIVVNATSVGMGSRDLPCDVGLLRADQVARHHLSPALYGVPRRRRARGARNVEGLGMLVYQAVLQAEFGPARVPTQPSCGPHRAGVWSRGASSLELMLRNSPPAIAWSGPRRDRRRCCPPVCRSRSKRSKRRWAGGDLGYGRGPRQSSSRRMDLLGGVRHGLHARLSGRHRDQEQRMVPQRQMAPGDVTGARLHEAAATQFDRGTRDLVACRSTVSPMPRRSRAGQRSRGPPHGLPLAPLSRKCCPNSGVDPVACHPEGAVHSKASSATHCRPRPRRRVTGTLLRLAAEAADDRRESKQQPRTATRSAVLWRVWLRHPIASAAISLGCKIDAALAQRS